MLPLKKDGSYAVIGAFAETPRYQGAGSSKINPIRSIVCWILSAKMALHLNTLRGMSWNRIQSIRYCLKKLLPVRKGRDGVLVFAGLPDSYESEGFDRTHLNMPESHTALIEAVAAVNPM